MQEQGEKLTAWPAGVLQVPELESENEIKESP